MTPEQRQKAIDYAEQKYALPSNDDVELLPCDGTYKAVAHSEDGAWVLAQVWVPKEIYQESDDGN